MWSSFMRFNCKLATAALALAAGAALATGAAAQTLTNAAFFDADATGTNTSGNGQITRGAWSTVLDQQNVPGNFGAEFFLATVANPTPTQFLSPSAALSAGLSQGVNTFYFFADSDDTAGGTAGFGLNLFLDGAGQLAPSISAFVVPGQTAVTDSAGCTAGFAFTCAQGAGTFSFTSGATTVTLTDFQVTARGGPGGTSTVDLVNSSNTEPFAPPPHPDGITDTYGSFTLEVTTLATPGVPEPATWALLMAGFGGVGAALRRARRTAAAAAG